MRLGIGFGGEKGERGCEDCQPASLASEVGRFMGSPIPTYESFSRKKWKITRLTG